MSQPAGAPHIVTVASGKGGVGKTNLVANMAVTLSRMGRRVLVFDADLGLASVDVLLGLAPRFTVRHVLEGKMPLAGIVVSGPDGIDILPAGSGVTELAELSKERAEGLLCELTELATRYDMLLVDAPSGIAGNALRACWLADELLLMTTPEPTSVTDAYALVKLLMQGKPELPIRLVVNQAGDLEEASQVAQAFSDITARFLGFPTACLGGLPLDPVVPEAVRRQQPFVTCYPQAQVSRLVRRMSRCLIAARESAGSCALRAPLLRNRISKYLGERKDSTPVQP